MSDRCDLRPAAATDADGATTPSTPTTHDACHESLERAEAEKAELRQQLADLTDDATRDAVAAQEQLVAQ